MAALGIFAISLSFVSCGDKGDSADRTRKLKSLSRRNSDSGHPILTLMEMVKSFFLRRF